MPGRAPAYLVLPNPEPRFPAVGRPPPVYLPLQVTNDKGRMTVVPRCFFATSYLGRCVMRNAVGNSFGGRQLWVSGPKRRIPALAAPTARQGAECRFPCPQRLSLPPPRGYYAPASTSYPQRRMPIRACKKPSNSIKFGSKSIKKATFSVKKASKKRAFRHAHLNILGVDPLCR